MSRPRVGFIQPYPSPRDTAVGKPPGPVAAQFSSMAAGISGCAQSGPKPSASCGCEPSSDSNRHTGEGTERSTPRTTKPHGTLSRATRRRGGRTMVRRMMPRRPATAKSDGATLLLTISMRIIPYTVWWSAQKPIPARLRDRKSRRAKDAAAGCARRVPKDTEPAQGGRLQDTDLRRALAELQVAMAKATRRRRISSSPSRTQPNCSTRPTWSLMPI